MARRASSAGQATNENPDAVAACYTEYASMMSDRARLNYAMGTMFEKYEKSDGVDKKAVKAAFALAAKDPAEADRQDRKNREYARIVGVLKTEENGQVAMGEEIAPHVAMPSKEMQAQVAAAKAFGDGYNTGLAGGLIDACKHGPGSEEFVRWRDGWTDGYADRIARKPEAAQHTEAQPRRPVGRPKGSGKKNGNGQPQVSEPIDQTDIEEAILGAIEDKIGEIKGNA